MTKRKRARYGSWNSPISSDLIASEIIDLKQIALDGEAVYWGETRPSEGGRNAIVRWTPGDGTEEAIPPDFNARTRVHEYGGGDFTIHDGTLYFSNFSDQRLYRQNPGATPQPITPQAKIRYADSIVDAQRNRLICVREDHRDTHREATNTVVSIGLDHENSGEILVAGNDFYAAPRLSPDGKRLAWLTWNHPNMPWDGTELWVGELDAEGKVGQKTRVAGGADESIFQPEWSPDGVLHFVSDRSEWWNLYRWQEGKVEALHKMEAEFGRPQWGLNMSTYGFETTDSIICAYTQNGFWHLARLHTASGEFSPLTVPYTYIEGRSNLRVGAGFAMFTGASPTKANALVRLNLQTHQAQELRQSSRQEIDPGYLSPPEAIEFPTANGLMAHAFYYAPANRDYEAPAGEKPPLIVVSHGGPTSSAETRLNLKIQYWTSRGFGVLDVNYGGSTGYGRSYRQRLNGQWGILDVADCINGARYLVRQGRVDGERLAIRGGSAGGYTTLCALTFHDTFDAGASHYGVSDLEALAKETHKFESRYLDNLVGPYPQRRDIYKERSPIHFVERINTPLILFQGLEDEVVPPNQAQKMFAAVRTKGIPTAFLAFAGEQHGFRRAENIRRALDAELYFYSKVFGFEPAPPLEPVPIENIP